MDRKVCGTGDPGRRDWLRFGVRGHDGRWGPTWKVWSQVEGDRVGLAIGSRFLPGKYVFTCDADRWSVRFDRSRTSPGLCSDARVIHVSPLPDSMPESEGLPLLSIQTGPAALTQPPLRGRFRYIAGIPLYPGMANETLIVALAAGAVGRKAVGWGPSGRVLLGSLTLSERVRIAILYRALPADAMRIDGMPRDAGRRERPGWPADPGSHYPVNSG